MLKAVVRLDERSGEKFLYIVPETQLEEKFVLWFCNEHNFLRERVNRRDSIRLPGYNDPEEAVRNIYPAFREFKQRFRYVEIPDLRGVDFDRAVKELRDLGLTWTLDGEREDPRFPPGAVVWQHPPPGSAVIGQSVVRIARNPV